MPNHERPPAPKISLLRHQLNFPNFLTVLRITLIPLVGFLMGEDRAGNGLRFLGVTLTMGQASAWVVLIASITDLLDGYLARRWKSESLFGKFLDPVADKLLLMVGLIALAKLDRVAPWLVMALLSREFFITGLRGIAIGEGLILSADRFGKVKLIFQMTGLAMLMWGEPLGGISMRSLGLLILYAALVLSLYSGGRYLADFLYMASQKDSGRDF